MPDRKIEIEELMNRSNVRFGTSGARGLASDMTDEVCYAYTVAFLQYLESAGALQEKDIIGVGGDFRPSTDRIMQAVRRSNTAPEQRLATGLRALGFRFRRHPKHLPGKPDIYFPAAKLVVFVHGCFWHGHASCRKGRSLPKTRRAYWAQKIKRNRRRDRRVARALRAAGYSVYTIWACELRQRAVPARLLTRLASGREGIRATR